MSKRKNRGKYLWFPKERSHKASTSECSPGEDAAIGLYRVANVLPVLSAQETDSPTFTWTLGHIVTA